MAELSYDEIWSVVAARKQADVPAKRRMVELRELYHAPWVIPMWDTEQEANRYSTIPALVTDAIDMPALRACTTRPRPYSPPVDYSKETGVRSHEYARIRASALRARWKSSKLNLQRRRYFRHLRAYGTAALEVVPHPSGRAAIVVRDPLCAYTEPRAIETLDPPNDCAWVYGVSSKQLIQWFPETRSLVESHKQGRDSVWEVLEWIDSEQIVIGVLGVRGPEWLRDSSYLTEMRGDWRKELFRRPNRAVDGIVPCYAPQRITLAKVAGQIDHLLPGLQAMARLQAYTEYAHEKAILPDRYAIGVDDREPEIVGDAWKDGRTGDLNLLRNVKQIGELQSNVGFQVPGFIDHLERNFRVSAGLPPQFGGESVGANLRTGRALDTMASYSIDQAVMEIHDIDTDILEHLDTCILAIEKGYWPRKTFTVFSGGHGPSGMVTYTPSVHFETFENSVEYPLPGADMADLTVASIQASQSGIVSKSTARVLSPLVDDEELEERQIVSEQLDEVLMASVRAQGQDGTMPAIDIARVKQLYRRGAPFEEAVIRANTDAQKRQAELVAAEAPAAQPGLAMPGMGVESMALPPGPPPTAPLPPQQGMAALMAALNSVPADVNTAMPPGVGAQRALPPGPMT